MQTTTTDEPRNTLEELNLDLQIFPHEVDETAVNAAGLVTTFTTPEVAYRDWPHFVSVVYRTKALFNKAMETAVVTDAATYDALRARVSSLHAFRDPVYEDHALRHFAGEARLIMKQITLETSNSSDIHRSWTRAVADSIFNRIMRVARVYRDVIVYHHAYNHGIGDQLPDTTDINQWPHLFEFKAQHMYDLMKQEVDTAFGGQCPWHRHSFDNSFVAALLRRNFFIVDNPPYVCLSTSQVHAIRLAFVSGTHKRIGANSGFTRFDDNLCALIFSYVFLPDSQSDKVLGSIVQWLY